VASCVHDNESSGFKKDGEFLKQLCDYQLLKKDSVPRNYRRNIPN
jgi:hypothetical protein